MKNWKDTEVLITGGTGSLGKTLTRILIGKYRPKGIRIYSRDELKQWQMKQEFGNWTGSKSFPIAFLIGDVRDEKRLDLACKNVDLVFNLAAMKQVPACEYNPSEAIKTNVMGAQNVLSASLKNKVPVVMHISTDKAVYPVNFYGMTKGCAEKLFIHGNVYAGGHGPIFSCVRYGNVLGSRGSVIPLFKEQAKTGVITVTHPEMTRFWITLNRVANFVIQCAEKTVGGEIFVPKMPSMKVVDLAQTVVNDPSVEIKYTGMRRGEKLHECLITWEESKQVIEAENYYVIEPHETGHDWFTYTSLGNPWQLTKDELKEMIE